MKIMETISTYEGEKRYSVVEQIGEFFGSPMYKDLFRGTLEQCKEYLEKTKEQYRG